MFRDSIYKMSVSRLYANQIAADDICDLIYKMMSVSRLYATQIAADDIRGFIFKMGVI